MAYDRSIFSSPAYWIALGAGVVGIGAAAMQGRRGSRSRETPYYIDDRRDGLKELRQLRYRADRWNPRYKGQGHPRDVIAGGTLEEIASDEAVLPGAAAAVANYRDRSARGSASTGRVEQGLAWDVSFDRGSAAVDPVKRYRDLQRMAAPGSGASDNERAMAKRLLATMTPPPQQSPRTTRRSTASSESGFGRWADKYQPWQTDPRDRGEIYRNDLTDLNFAKKAIYEHASAPRVKVFLQGFDGTYLRSAFHAFSSLDDLGYAAGVLEAWGEPYFKRDGVFEAVIGSVKGENQIRILRIRGRDVSGLGLVIQNEDFYDEERFSSFNDQLARHLAARVEAQAQKMR